MPLKTSVIIPYSEENLELINLLKCNPLVGECYVLTSPGDNTIPDSIPVDNLYSSDSLIKISTKDIDEYILLFTENCGFDPGQFAFERFLDVAASTNAGLIYSDYFEIKNGQKIPHETIDYQFGSIRDNFDFGAVILLKSRALLNYVKFNKSGYNFSGLYDLRLYVSRNYSVIRIPEKLYTRTGYDSRKSGEKNFDYVDPKNQQVQSEYEAAATVHLKEIGAWLKPEFDSLPPANNSFKIEASVIIPVKNREKTIGEAVKSALKSKNKFRF